MRLQTRLLLILAAALTPVLAVQFYNQAELRREREAHVAENARREAELVHETVASVISGGQQMARLIASDSDVVERRPGCREDLEEALASDTRFTSLALYDAQGEAWCRAGATAIGEAEAGLARTAMATWHLQLGVFQKSERLGRHLPVAYPLSASASDAPEGALVAGLDLDWLGRFLASLEHPAGRTIVIADREGTILTRYPEHQRWSGESFLPIVAPLVDELQPGQAIVPSFDGLDRLIGYMPPSQPPGGLWSSVGYVMSDVTADIDRVSARGYALIGASAVLALLLALLTGHYVIRRPTVALLDAIEKAKAGDFTARPDIPLGGRSEFAMLAAAYVDLAGALRDRETQRQLLMQELNHRVRNTLATAIGLVRGTAREERSVRAFRDDIVDRLQALSRIQTLGDGHGERSETLDLVVEAELVPHRSAGATGRITTGGPRVELKDEQVQAFGLALHELATNASKYGALSTPSGRLNVSWTIADAPARLKFVWRETGVPCAAAPSREGFGTLLIRQLVEVQLHGELDRHFDERGLQVTIEVPLVR